MEESESANDKADRLYRLLDRLIQRVEAGDRADKLREQLVIDVMMSPLLAEEQEEVFRRFDEAVAQAPKLQAR